MKEKKFKEMGWGVNYKEEARDAAIKAVYTLIELFELPKDKPKREKLREIIGVLREI